MDKDFSWFICVFYFILFIYLFIYLFINLLLLHDIEYNIYDTKHDNMRGLLALLKVLTMQYTYTTSYITNNSQYSQYSKLTFIESFLLFRYSNQFS